MSKLGCERSLFWLLISFHGPKVRPRWQAKTQTFLSDQMNPTHQISGTSTPKSPLYRAGTQMFSLLTSCACHVKLWREAIWGCEGGVTSTRRAWPAMVTFCHMVGPDAPSIMQPSVVLTHESHSGKKSVLCLQKITLLSPLPKLAAMITILEASWISSYLSFLHERERIMVAWHPGIVSSFPATCDMCLS